jgi:hypothetical protein
VDPGHEEGQERTTDLKWTAHDGVEVPDSTVEMWRATNESIRVMQRQLAEVDNIQQGAG